MGIRQEALESALIREYIEDDPDRPGIEDARLAVFAVPVWAIIGHLRAAGGDVTSAARAYDLPEDAVRAALAFYERHREVIDARLAANVVSTI